MKKRIIALLLVAALMISTAVCANAEENGEGENEALVGIVAAMESEIAAIKEATEIEQTYTVAGLDFCVGQVDQTNVVVVECGMGKVNAALATQILIDRFQVTAIINIGCAGSLNDELDIGDFVVSTEVVQHDYDITALGYEKGEIPYIGKVSFEADANLIQVACEAIAQAAPDRKVVTGRICTGDQFISTEEQKQTIIESMGGMCAEMEGAAVGQTATVNGVPFVVIRAMSDKSNSAEDFTNYVDQVTREGAEVVIKMLSLLNAE